MESALQVPVVPMTVPLQEISVFTKRILRIDGISRAHEHNYLQENIYFSHVTVNEVFSALERNEVVDAIFLHTEAINKNVAGLSKVAREKAIPLIVYTRKFEPSAKKIALDLNADDYQYGAINDVLLKRIDFLKKLKTYKNERGNKPYEAKQRDESPQFKFWALKRTMDIAVSLIALILISPLLLIIAVVIKLESKGPVFYISKRAGSGYKIFDFYKFRSMRVGADAELKNLAHMNQYAENSDKGVFFKIKNDPRVTAFGAFLRQTSLDELPQLFNVLLGDMSLVGNRPLPLYEAQQLTNDKIAWRFLAPAGITGLWQITKRGKDNMSPEERIALDMEYAMKNSFWLDVKILLSTMPALLQKEKV
jgi:lipopolysaccharide/colanic/teichoic acid biosynthesis glycosyltransferase